MVAEDLLKTPLNEHDYILAITAGKPSVTLLDKGKENSSPLDNRILSVNEEVQNAVSGVLENPLKVGGELVMKTHTGRMMRESIIKMGIVETEPREVITIKTNRRVYEVLMRSDDPIHMSLKFMKNGYLDYDDPMPNGFFISPGRNREDIFITNKGKIYAKHKHSERTGSQLILFDSSKDENLETAIEVAKRLIEGRNEHEKVMALMAYVRNELSQDLMEENEQKETITTENGEFIPIGNISVGQCVHKAALFKYLADRVGIKCRLVDGMSFQDKSKAEKYKQSAKAQNPAKLPRRNSEEEGFHVWNVVEIKGKEYFIDIENYPNELIKTTDPEAGNVVRTNGKGEAAGGTGTNASVLFRIRDIT